MTPKKEEELPSKLGAYFERRDEYFGSVDSTSAVDQTS